VKHNKGDDDVKLKKSTLVVLQLFPNLEGVLKSEENKGALNDLHRVMLDLCLFFEDPDDRSFDMKWVYQLQDQHWIQFVFEAFQVFYEKDTYLFVESNPSFIHGEEEYLNQTEFARFLNEQGLSFSQNKIAVYLKRGTFPNEDLMIAGKPYWLKETAKKYADSKKEIR
jgi:hypothetical protein